MNYYELFNVECADNFNRYSTRCDGWNANVDDGDLGIYPKKWEGDQLSHFSGKGVQDVLNGVLYIGRCYNLGVARGNFCEMCDHTASFLANASDRRDTSLALEKQSRALPVHNTHPTPLEPIESIG
ncbi:hypothetical protein TNIN_268611 [Trichonephila inaurata madagascariensis]|uniref:Uncharacterized protein n=1 Tax=Trichonephila inaurata madagascariensis TaxID=2747483 RepID=A0A8X6JIV3_9ARAC|nr:hypothetical protein TNIN_268611 [Trichonephila inaurata madagascariensis]